MDKSFVDDDLNRCNLTDPVPRENKTACTQFSMPFSVQNTMLLRRLRAMARDVSLEAPWEAANASALDSVSVLEWLQQEGLDEGGNRDFLNNLVAIPLSTDISKLRCP